VKHRDAYLAKRFDIANAFRGQRRQPLPRHAVRHRRGDLVARGAEGGRDAAGTAAAELPRGGIRRRSSRVIVHTASFNANAIQLWDWKLKQFVSAAPAPAVVPGPLRPAADARTTSCSPSSPTTGTSIQLLPIFPSTQALLRRREGDGAALASPAADQCTVRRSRAKHGQWCFEARDLATTRGRLAWR